MEEMFFCPNCMANSAPVDGKCPFCGCDVNIQNASYQLPVNTILNGRYVIGKVLGAGGFGITYIGYDLKLDSKVAVKEYYPSGAANRSMSLTVFPTTTENGNPFEIGKDRFLKEAKTLSGFVGEGNIVALRDYFEENGTAYIVMEYLEGEDLSHYAKKHDTDEHDKDLQDELSVPDNNPVKNMNRKSQQNRRKKKNLIIIATAVAVVLVLTLVVVLVPSQQTQANQVVEKAETESNASVNIEPSAEPASTPDPNIEKLAAVRDAIAEHCETTISQGDDHLVVILADGTVYAVGDNDKGQCNVSGWTDIIAVSAGENHTVGLKTDGTVVATKYIITDEELGLLDRYGYGHQCDVAGWSDIVAISAGEDYSVGLKSDGTVVATGFDACGQCNVEGWTNIVAVSAGCDHTVGLKADGTVVAVGSNDDGQCEVAGWTDIVAVSAGRYHTVGLKADGTVVAVGGNDDGQCNVSDWTDIVAVSAGYYTTVGLKADGTVVEAGARIFSISDWCNIVAISSGGYGQNLGLKADGTVVTSAIYFESALSGLITKLPVAG